MTGILQDLRYAWRLWVKHPGTAIISILALAIGIGAASAIFAIVNAVLIQPLPYRDPDRLVMLWNVNDREGVDITQLKRRTQSFSHAEYADWRTRSGLFEDVMAFVSQAMRVTQTDDPGIVLAYRLSPGAFPMMGVSPMLGRGFEPHEERPGADRVVVLQHHVWQQRYHGDPAIIGRQIRLNNEPYTVIGVMPPDFVMFNRQMDVMVPWRLADVPDERMRASRFLRGMARLKPGITTEQAQARSAAFSEELARDHPQTNAGWRMMLVPHAQDAAGEHRLAALLLLAAVGCVLIITCANIASLLLVQASVRSRELALRIALGAGRFRLSRQMLIEGLLLASFGGVLGLGLAYGAVRLFQSMVPERTSHGRYLVHAAALQFDLAVFGFVIFATVCAAVAIILLPAWRASRADVNIALKEKTRGTVGGVHDRAIRNTLLVTEVALAALLAVGSTLLVRSLAALYAEGPGFQPAGLIALDDIRPFVEDVDEQVRRQKLTGLEAGQLYEAADRSFRHRLYGELDRVPGLIYTAGRSLMGGNFALNALDIEGRPQPSASEEPPRSISSNVRAGYFNVLGIPLLKGRDFSGADGPDAIPVAIVSEEFVRRYYPGQDPLGKRFRFRTASNTAQWLTIIGVAGDIREDGMDRPPQPMLFFHEDQSRFPGSIIFRARSGDSAALVPAVRQAVARADPRASVYRAVALESQVRGSAWQLHYSTTLLTSLAALALLLALLGVYGLLSYAVRERTQEIGVRMAIGAERYQVMWPIMREGTALVSVGILIGLTMAVALTRFLGSLLFGVPSHDPASFIAVALLLISAGALASYLPARRASRVDPLVALRYE